MFSAYSPSFVAPGSNFLLDIWAHTSRQTREVLERAREMGRDILSGSKGPNLIDRGSVLTVEIDLPGFQVEDPTDVMTWLGEPTNVSFPIRASENLRPGLYTGRARIACMGIAICKLRFQITLTPEEDLNPRQLPSESFHPATAFASYASEDRDEVLGRVQGMQKANPNLDVFLDVMSLRSGTNWREELEMQVPRKDTFYLFWSRHAATSEWVDLEWRLALDQRGIDYIDPVPLEDPSEAPPPAELHDLHFNDHFLAFMKTKQ
jgi:hypothetical protein